MPNLFQKLKQNLINNSDSNNLKRQQQQSTNLNDDRPKNIYHHNHNLNEYVSNTQSQFINNENSLPNNLQKFSTNNNNSIKNSNNNNNNFEAQSFQSSSLYSIGKNSPNHNTNSKGFVLVDKLNNEKDKNNNIINTNNNKKQLIDNAHANTTIKKSPSVLSLIIDSTILNEENVYSDKNKIKNQNNMFQDVNIFDPEPAQDEADTFDKTTFLDDRSFIVDEDNIPDNEVAEINKQKLNGFVKESNCYTINEVPEGRLSKMNSSRASSRSSLGSGSTRTSSNFYEQSDHVSSLADMNKSKRLNNNNNNSEESSSQSDSNNMQNGSKNILLDALLRKFNVDMDINANEDETNATMATKSVTNNQILLLPRQQIKYIGDDQKRKQTELQRKINRTQMEKQQQINSYLQQQQQLAMGNISDDIYDHRDATSSFDDEPKQIKIIRSTGTQMSQISKLNSNFKERISNNHTSAGINNSNFKLPQSFECKYIGKTKCNGLWGIKNTREPVDRLVTNAKRHKSLDDLANVEALVSEKGIYIVNKPKSLTNENYQPHPLKSSASFLKNKIISTSHLKSYKSGLLPISNISYAAQDNVYSKIFSCIVVREREEKTLSECYSFLCSRNEHARRMALSITMAFKEYGKLLQLKESRISNTIKLQDNHLNNQPDSFA